MSAQDLALAANPEVQAAIRALGGAVPNLTDAVKDAQAKALESVMKSATEQAAGLLQGFSGYVTQLVAEGNALAREVAKNQEKQTKAARANAYFTATGNIFPLRKLIGIPTPKDVLDTYPKIDEIPENWVAPTPAAATTSGS